MAKQLDEYCRKENYDKILAVVESKTVSQNNAFPSLILTQDDWSMLREYIEEKATLYLRFSGTVPMQLMKISPLLGQEFHMGLLTLISKYITSKEITEFAQHLTIHFRDLNDLEGVFRRLEEAIEHMTSYYVCHFDLTGIILQYLDYALAMVKQKLCDFFFSHSADMKYYSQGLEATILFEKRLLPFLREKNCCSNCNANLQNEGAVVLENAHKDDSPACFHRKMLSTTFLPHIGAYFRDKFASTKDNPAHRDADEDNGGAKKCENPPGDDNSIAIKCGILPVFLHLFKRVEAVYETILYFDDPEISAKFINEVHANLTRLILEIRLSGEISDAAVVLNTLAYIQETFQELSFKLGSSSNPEADSTSPEMEPSSLEIESSICTHLSQKEQSQIVLVEKEINYRMKKALLDKKRILKSSIIAAYIKSFYEDAGRELCTCNDDIKRGFSEIINSQIFSLVISTKMNEKRAEAILQEITDIESFLAASGTGVYHIKLIKEYLKIFICQNDDADGFISNFDLIAKNNFSFPQILNAFEDKEKANTLFIKYKQRLGSEPGKI